MAIKRVRARAPLRLGLAGGGTDLSPFCDQYGGNVLNCTVTAYAYAVIQERDDWWLTFHANDIESSDETVPSPLLDTSVGLALHRGVYNRIVRDFHKGRPIAIDVYTSVDAPPGSGLGSSSALVVALVKAYAELLRLPLGDYDVARLALEIERIDLGMAGGKQDQYAAAFGGCNFIEFLPDERVIVNPLRVHESHMLEIESSLMVCHTGTSRVSSSIIEMQTESMKRDDPEAIAALQQIKSDAIEMKLAVLRGDVTAMGEILTRSWAAKKRTATGVSNSSIDSIYDLALRSGAIAGKISGAGGGGYLMLLVPPERRPQVARKLTENGLMVLPVQISHLGAEAWTATK
jgi:D-glycero-alpha-D-manno-heptose-7-phosphate kinase